MLKRFRISALILAAATLMAVMPAVSQARDRDDYRGRPAERHQIVRRPDRGRFGAGAFAGQSGYWDSHGVWCAYGR